MNTELLIIAGGILHLGILIASSQVPRVLDWKGHLAPLPAFLRTLFWVYGAFIVLTIFGFGALSLLFTGELAGGSGLARGFCGFVCLFWTARLAVQLFIFDGKELVKTRWQKGGYHMLTGVFVLLPLIYGYVAFAQ